MPPNAANTSRAEISFSLTHGGPLHRLLLRSHLTHDDKRDPRNLALATALFCWLPLVAAAALHLLLTGRRDAVLTDFAVHARFLLVLPLVFLGERSLDLRCTEAVRRFEMFVGKPGGPGVAGAVVQARRLRNAVLPEMALVVVALLTAQTRGEGGFIQFWSRWVALPIFVFLICRLLWRWLIWSNLLVRLSRLPLPLSPAHPDRCGGLYFLSEPSVALAPIALGLGILFASIWGMQVVFSGASARIFGPYLALLTAIVVGIAFVPLCAFVDRLVEARIKGLHDYGALALRYVRKFDQRWIAESRDEDLLGTADLQSLADMGTTYSSVKDMRPVPFSVRGMLAVAAALLLPMIPLAATEIPLPQLARNILGALLGGH